MYPARPHLGGSPQAEHNLRGVILYFDKLKLEMIKIELKPIIRYNVVAYLRRLFVFPQEWPANMKFNFLRKILPHTRVSHPISALLRPLFENKRIWSMIGGVLVLGCFTLGISLYPPREPVRAFGQYQELELITEKLAVNPVPDTIGTSQGYSVFHRGIDFRAPKGSPVYPMMNGKVIYVISLGYGYGRHVLIDHGNGLTTLYAHLGRIFVEEGEEVSKETEIAEVGLTGRTTGYHLHFEVREDMNAVNPWPYLR